MIVASASCLTFFEVGPSGVYTSHWLGVPIQPTSLYHYWRRQHGPCPFHVDSSADSARMSSFAAAARSRPDVGKAPGHLELKASDPAAFEFLISGVKNEHRKLLSGVARFRGTYVEKHKENSSLEFDGPTDGLVAIDGGKVRFDMSGPGWAVDHKSVERIPNSAMVKGRTVRGRCTTRFADDRSRVTLWHSNNSMAVIALPRDLPDRSAYQYVDIRGITLLSPGAIAKQLTLERGM